MQRSDFALLVEWFAAPHVVEWWTSGPTVDDVEEEYGDAIDGIDPTESFIIEVDGDAVGFIERYLLHEHPKWEAIVALGSPAAGIDYFLGRAEYTGRGIGSGAIAQFVSETWDDPKYSGTNAVVAVPQQANRRSWRALERTGFTLVRAVDDLQSDDPDDKGPAFIYACWRPPLPME